MGNNDLVAAIAGKVEMKKVDVEKVLKAMTAVVHEEIAKNETVKISKLGTFVVVDRAERKGMNPKTKEEMVIPATKAPKFKCSKDLKVIAKSL